MNPQKSKARLAVEQYFSTRPMSHTATRAEIELVCQEDCAKTIHNLCSVGWLVSLRTPGVRGVKYQRCAHGKPAPAPASHKKARGAHLTNATNGPGFRISGPVGSMDKATDRISNGSVDHRKNPYKAPEMAHPAGVTPDRLAFLEIPSRMGNRRYYRDGRVELVNGGQA